MESKTEIKLTTNAKKRQIGKGGFASVWDYFDTLNQESVAVKISGCNDPQDVAELMQELRILEAAQIYKNVV